MVGKGNARLLPYTKDLLCFRNLRDVMQLLRAEPEVIMQHSEWFLNRVEPRLRHSLHRTRYMDLPVIVTTNMVRY